MQTSNNTMADGKDVIYYLACQELKERKEVEEAIQEILNILKQKAFLKSYKKEEYIRIITDSIYKETNTKHEN